MTAARCSKCHQFLPIINGIVADGNSLSVRRGEAEIGLSKSEFAIFSTLLGVAGHTFSPQELRNVLTQRPSLAAIRQYILRTRRKLRPLSIDIDTVRGKGWRIPRTVGETAPLEIKKASA